MRQRDVFPTYRDYCSKMNNVYNIMLNNMQEDYVDQLCAMRGYIDKEQINLIKDMKLGNPIIDDATILGEDREYLGLVTKNDEFLLNNRFIVPIRDIAGNIVAFVGYYKDYKKYITTPSLFFSKNSLFFNMEYAYRVSWEKYNGVVILVEGIFDALSLRAIGLPAIATMGSVVQEPKSEQLRLFRKVIAIADNDKVGREAMSLVGKKAWKLPSTATRLLLKGKCRTEYGDVAIKDCDNLVTFFDKDSIVEMIMQFKDSKEAYVTLEF